MKTPRIAIALLATSLLAGTAWAQTSSNQAPPPLNTTLPQANSMPSSLLPASSSSSAKPGSAPGAYYGDTSGRMGNADEHTASSSQTCDDSTYNQPQVHGDVGMGVMSGSHTSGSYQSGAVSVTKNLGDCDHPSGGVSFSVGVSQGQFHGRGW